MKAVILTAGVGSRIRPLTNDKPKSLLQIGNKSILERMIDSVKDVDITELVIVTGYLHDQIEERIMQIYPKLHIDFVYNEKYLETNTGYSLRLANQHIKNDSFIKFDADVVFEQAILEKLVYNDYPTSLCMDKNINLEAEEVKVISDRKGKVVQVGKKIDPHLATGESIGIEKIDTHAAQVLFAELDTLMRDKRNWQEYYDDSYTTLVKRGVKFQAIDISGLKWVEIDTIEDYKKATTLFSK